jgi:predicted DNA-binding protein (UPF0278 family)
VKNLSLKKESVMSDYNDKVSEFFYNYVKPIKNGITNDGNLTEAAMKQTVKLLIKERVFRSEKEIIMKALKDYRVFLPCCIFENG